MKAKAAVAVAPGRVEFQNVNVPDPGPEDVVVRVLHSWISNGTEGSFVRGERIAGDTPRSENDPMPFPHVPGYQKVGIAESVGSKVTNIKAGELVFATVSQVSDMFYSSGGHISPAVTHQSQIWKLPTRVDPIAASGLVLTQVGYNTGMRSVLNIGDAAVVIGDGMVGHWTAQTLKHRGAKVLMLGRHDKRLNLFEKSSEDRTVNVRKENLGAAVRAWAPEGVQVVADTVGSISTIESLITMMKHDSSISSAGFYGNNGKIDIQKLRDREITLQSPSGWRKERMDKALEMLQAGVIKTLPLITHHFPAQKCAEAFDMILSKKDNVLGVILDWE